MNKTPTEILSECARKAADTVGEGFLSHAENLDIITTAMRPLMESLQQAEKNHQHWRKAHGHCSEARERIIEERDSLKLRVAELELANKNANALIGAQADENDKINSALKLRVAELEKDSKRIDKIEQAATTLRRKIDTTPTIELHEKD